MSKQIDPRGPRFGAALTTVVLAVVLISMPSPIATLLLVLQTIVFGLGAFVGLHVQPYGIMYRKLIARRLGSPKEREDAQPPQFAQLVGFVFAFIGLVGLLTGATIVGQIAVGFALGAAFLNTAFGICLGCEMYVMGKKVLAHS